MSRDEVLNFTGRVIDLTEDLEKLINDMADQLEAEISTSPEKSAAPSLDQ